jgi:adenosylcobinamide-GDP ribazoletransferase
VAEVAGAAPRLTLAREARAAAAAVSFLTRIPLGRLVAVDDDDVARAGLWFPAVGACIGAAVGAVAGSLASPLSPLLGASLALVVYVLLTGALHVDALADSADALGARSRARALEIMREHTIGAYGAAAVALDLLVRLAALAALAARTGTGELVCLAIAAGALARAVPVALAAALPYARPAGGAGASLTRGGAPRAVAAAAVAGAIAVAAAGWDGAILAGCAVALALAALACSRRALGGVTGDTLGAALEVTETLLLVAAVGLVGPR